MYKPGGTIMAALQRIRQKRYVLPALQREFVWKPEQIERLFDSLMQGYPFGTFLLWRVDPATSAKFRFYDFILNYHERDAAHCPAHRIARSASKERWQPLSGHGASPSDG